jgi:glycosyltransferase involved in cell wall biosynthesis
MKYLVYQDWPNTSGNHAGIKYLCDYLAREYPLEYQSIPMPPDIVYNIYLPSIFGRIELEWKRFYFPIRNAKRIRSIIKMLIKKLKDDDKVFLMEYMIKRIKQNVIAESLKRCKQEIPVYAMAHITPTKTELEFNDCELKMWLEPIDMLLTLGHSLTDFYVSKGYPALKIHTSFHYVDQYYLNDVIEEHDGFSVIVMGNMARDVDLLRKVVLNNHDIYFRICKGMYDYQDFNFDNVKLLPFLPEDELRKEMKESDVSLNIMTDTVGSNVIVTSLAMGLAMICSDVGSIRDYCDESNTIFCNTEDDFNKALKYLRSSNKSLFKMRQSAREKANSFLIEKFHKGFSRL